MGPDFFAGHLSNTFLIISKLCLPLLDGSYSEMIFFRVLLSVRYFLGSF